MTAYIAHLLEPNIFTQYSWSNIQAISIVMKSTQKSRVAKCNMTETKFQRISTPIISEIINANNGAVAAAAIPAPLPCAGRTYCEAVAIF